MRKTLVVALFVSLFVVLAGAVAFADRKGGEDGVKPANPTCPVMEGEEVDPTISVEYQGKRVWFCCDDCVEKFRAHPDEYVAKLPQFAATAPAGAPASAPPADPLPEAKAEHLLGALHPIAVHFPIALTMMGAFAAVLARLFGSAFFRHAAAYCILLGAVTVVPAYLLGGEAAEARGKMSDALEHRVETHEDFAAIALGTILAAGALQALSLLLPSSKPFALLALLAVLAGAGVVGFTGYLGGEILRPGHLKPLLSLLPF